MLLFDKKEYEEGGGPSLRDQVLEEKRERFIQYYQNLNRNHQDNIVNRIHKMKDFYNFMEEERITLYGEYPSPNGEQRDKVPTCFIPICFFITDEGFMKHIVSIDPNSPDTSFPKSEYEDLSAPLSTLGVTSSDIKDIKAIKIYESNQILIRDDIDQEFGEFLMVFNVDVNETKIKDLSRRYNLL